MYLTVYDKKINRIIHERICPVCNRIFYCLGNSSYGTCWEIKNNVAKNFCMCILCYYNWYSKTVEDIPLNKFIKELDNYESCTRKDSKEELTMILVTSNL